jgi:hypothetical protein
MFSYTDNTEREMSGSNQDLYINVSLSNIII